MQLTVRSVPFIEVAPESSDVEALARGETLPSALDKSKRPSRHFRRSLGLPLDVHTRRRFATLLG
jgi:hypothetical protein